MVASTSLPTSPIPHAHVIQADTDIDAELSLSLSLLHVYHSSNVVDTILRQACEVLPLSKLESLFLSMLSPARTQSVNWSEVFRHCTEVTTVQVYGYGTLGLLQALTPPHGSRDNDEGTQEQASDNDNNNNSVSAPMQVPIFPKLTSLLLESLNFIALVPNSGILYDIVLSVVNLRKAEKTPLSMLRITHCTIGVEEAAVLKKVVPDCQWDRYEGVDQDEAEAEDDEDENDEDEDDYNGFDYDYLDISDPDMRLGEFYAGTAHDGWGSD